MRRAFPFITALLIYVMMPSAGELVENVSHLVANGHIAHAIPDASHQPDDPEHGCSGPFHTCICHQSTSFLVGVATVSLRVQAGLAWDLRWFPDEPSASSYLASVFRPPIA